MGNRKTKVVGYRDESGTLKHSVLPVDVPDSEAPIGIPVGLVFPARWEPVREALEAALAARGIVTAADLHKSGADNLIMQAKQQVLAVDIQTLKKLNPKEK